jgi:hypothetical protein
MTTPQDEMAWEERRRHLIHSFGNLTLLTQALNSAVSNGPFPDKRAAVVRQSGLQLNAYFQDVEGWDEEAILHRGRRLFDKARSLWPHPSPE